MSYFNQDVLQQFAINLNVEALLSKDLFNNPILQKSLIFWRQNRINDWLLQSHLACETENMPFLILHTTDAKIASM